MSTDRVELEVWNLALDHVMEKPLGTVSDATAYGRWMTRNVPHIRDVLTRAYLWNFAMQLNTLTEDATAPAFRWAARYALPTDCLRVVPPTYLGGRYNNPLEYEVAQGFIYTDNRTTLYLRTIQRQVTFEDTWDSIAIDAFTLMLAYRMTHRFTGLATHRDRLEKEFEKVVRLAAEMDAFESTPEPVEQHSVLDVRDID